MVIIKLGDADMAIRALMRTLHLLLVLSRGKSSQYIRAISVHMVLLLYNRKQNTPCWRMMQNSLSTFNEEAGEISFSTLARSCLGDTQRHDIKHMSKLYQLLCMYNDVEDDVEGDIASNVTLKSWRKKVTPESKEVEATVQFFLHRMRQIKNGTFQMYDGSNESYKKKSHADRHLLPFSGPKEALWMPDTTKFLEKHLKRCEKIYVSDWAKEHDDIWPGLDKAEEKKAVPDEDEDDEEEVQESSVSEEDDEEEEDNVDERKHNREQRISCLRIPIRGQGNPADERPHNDRPVNARVHSSSDDDGSLDADGGSVASSWTQWGNVNAQRNIIPEGDRGRRTRRKRNRNNDDFPMVNEFEDDGEDSEATSTTK
jgi:hypothetical protein